MTMRSSANRLDGVGTSSFMLPRAVARGVTRSGRDGRLDDVLAVGGRHGDVLPGSDERRVDHREPGCGEVGEVALVGVPAQDGFRVAQSDTDAAQARKASRRSV